MSDVLLFHLPRGQYAIFNNSTICRTFWFHFPPEVFEEDKPLQCSSSEKAFLGCKALFFGDFHTYEKIRKSKLPSDLRGLQIEEFSEDGWFDYREDFLFSVLLSKFVSCEKMKNALLKTGDKILGYAAGQNDIVWGIGLDISDPLAKDQRNWTGSNIQGNTLMKVRDYLRGLFD